MADQQRKVGEVSASGTRAEEQEIELFDYLLVIWRHRLMIAMLTVAAMVATVAVMFSTPRRYESSATIVPPMEVLQKEVGGRGLGALRNTVLNDIIDTSSVAGIYMEILRSRDVADALIDRFNLMEVYDKTQYQSRARERLARNSRIEMTEDGAVRISVTDLDPNRAAAIVDAYIEELDRRNKLLSTGQATSKRVFLETRLKEIEAKLGRIEEIPAHEAQVQQMLYDLLVRECELAKIEEAKSMPTIQVLDEAVVPELPQGRGTIQKGILAGLAAGMFGIFVVFTREYLQAARSRREQRAQSLVATRLSDRGTHTFQRGEEHIERSASTPELIGSESAKA